MATAQERTGQMEQTSGTELAERVRPIVNGILEGFNAQGVTTEEAGLVILALVHRLMTVLESDHEKQRDFVLNIINLVNQYLRGGLREE